MSVWILVAVLHLGWDGNDVKFQEFSSKDKCESAKATTSNALRESGGHHSWQLLCVEK